MLAVQWRDSRVLESLKVCCHLGLNGISGVRSFLGILLGLRVSLCSGHLDFLGLLRDLVRTGLLVGKPIILLLRKVTSVICKDLGCLIDFVPRVGRVAKGSSCLIAGVEEVGEDLPVICLVVDGAGVVSRGV